MKVSVAAATPLPPNAFIGICTPKLTKDGSSLQFTVALLVGDLETPIALFEGWRVKNGQIIPPSRPSDKRGGYVPLIRLSKNFYKTLIGQLQLIQSEYPTIKFPEPDSIQPAFAQLKEPTVVFYKSMSATESSKSIQ